jgi:ABC-2 type transport system ATP-binding protein
MSGENVIEVSGLKKRFEKVDALDGLELTVPRGSICGFLGRNGAGKTTTLKCLFGMVRPDSGTTAVLGLPASDEAVSVQIRRRAAFVPETKTLLPYMSVEQVVRFTRGFFPGWRSDVEKRLLEEFELPQDRMIPKLSKGMLSKLHFVLALSRGCEVLVLDEPTDGLDPVATEQVLQALVSYVAEQEGTILFSTHRLPEVEQIADRITMIDEGRTVLETSLDDLKAECRRVTAVFDEGAEDRAKEFEGAGIVTAKGRVVTVLVYRSASEIERKAREMGASSVESGPVGLKELFLEIVRN